MFDSLHDSSFRMSSPRDRSVQQAGCSVGHGADPADHEYCGEAFPSFRQSVVAIPNSAKRDECEEEGLPSRPPFNPNVSHGPSADDDAEEHNRFGNDGIESEEGRLGPMLAQSGGHNGAIGRWTPAVERIRHWAWGVADRPAGKRCYGGEPSGTAKKCAKSGKRRLESVPRRVLWL